MIDVTSVTVAISVGDLGAAQRWYEGVLAVSEPDLEPVEGILEYEVGGVWLQLSEADVALGGTVVPMGVPDVHADRARLGALGIEAGEVEVVDGVIAWWDFSDPDGNRLGLYTLLADGDEPSR